MSSRVKVTLVADKDGSQAVTTTYRSDGTIGVRMDIHADKDWLVLCTDSYEGYAMIHVEALPAVRRALARIAKARRPAASPGKREG